MSEGEGALIGCDSGGLFLVHAETPEHEHVLSRPFRFGAGALDNYVGKPAGAEGIGTWYNSEIKFGTSILKVSYTGDAAVITVDRNKEEIRQAIGIIAKTGRGDVINLDLQAAESVYLMNPKGKPLSVMALKKDDQVLVCTQLSGTMMHTGKAVKAVNRAAYILER